MAKRKRLKKLSFRSGARARKKSDLSKYKPIVFSSLKVLMVVCSLAGVILGFAVMEDYVKGIASVSKAIGTVELVNVPAWATDQLIEKIYAAVQGDSVVHINKITYDETSPRIKLWSDTLIKVKVPFANRDCSWFKDGAGEYRKRKVRVTVDGVDSNTKRMKVMTPGTCL